MKKEFFPHIKDGSINIYGTSHVGYNILPSEGISLDPRYIIKEFNDEELSWISPTEVYIGMQLYSLSNNTLYICSWKPNSTLFSGLDCLWDVVYTDTVDNTNEWVDIRDMKTTQDKILEKDTLLYKYINGIAGKGYFGFYNFSSSNYSELLNDPNILNGMFNELITYKSDNDHMSGYYSSMGMKSTKTLNMRSKNSTECKLNNINGNFVVIVPNGYKVNGITYMDNDKDPSPISKDLQLIGRHDEMDGTYRYLLDNYPYKIYIIDNKLSSADIDDLIAGNKTISINFAKETTN